MVIRFFDCRDIENLKCLLIITIREFDKSAIARSKAIAGLLYCI